MIYTYIWYIYIYMYDIYIYIHYYIWYMITYPHYIRVETVLPHTSQCVLVGGSLLHFVAGCWRMQKLWGRPKGVLLHLFGFRVIHHDSPASSLASAACRFPRSSPAQAVLRSQLGNSVDQCHLRHPAASCGLQFQYASCFKCFSILKWLKWLKWLTA